MDEGSRQEMAPNNNRIRVQIAKDPGPDIVRNCSHLKARLNLRWTQMRKSSKGRLTVRPMKRQRRMMRSAIVSIKTGRRAWKTAMVEILHLCIRVGGCHMAQGLPLHPRRVY